MILQVNFESTVLHGMGTGQSTSASKLDLLDAGCFLVHLCKPSLKVPRMKQILQSYRTGEVSVADIPAPGLEPGAVLILTARSLISVGTERQVLELAKRSLAGKARARPDLVQKGLDRLSPDGLLATRRNILNKLQQPIPLGDNCAGSG